MTGELHWRQLPALPDREGFASPFAGTSGGALVVAGGANFPDRRPWEGGTKHWYDTVFVLEPGADHWRAAGALPRPNAYGVSATYGDSLICVGGGDAERHFREAFRLTWKDGKIHRDDLPPLPSPCAFGSGALVGSVLYVSGGIDRPLATSCSNALWALDLAAPTPRWEQPPTCPGSERMLAVAGSAGGSLYLFSGTRLSPGADVKPVREYLRDAWRYTPGQGWRRLADLPRAAVAAPSPAPLVPGGKLLVISGDDGTKVSFKPETEHPGFPRQVLAYDIKADHWSGLGDGPLSRATVPTVDWGPRVVIPNGESRPGYRTPEVWAFDVEARQ